MAIRAGSAQLIMFWGLLAAGVFAWLAGMLLIVGLRAGRGQIPFDSPLGIRGPRVRQSESSWVAAHRAAAPFLLTGAAIALLQAGGCAWAALSTRLQGGPYLWILIGTGALLIAMLLVLAKSAGNRAAR